MSLRNRTLFITGASRGIGLAIALRAARDGANVIVAAKTAEPHPKLPGTIHTAARAIEEAGGRALPLVVDVREEDAVAAAVEKAVVKVPPSTQGKGARITQPEYPPASRRAGEAGTVTLQVFVQENGRAGEVKVAKSSGFAKLDEAAVKEVQRNWRFVPGKEDGKPVSMWHTFQVTFRLTD